MRRVSVRNLAGQSALYAMAGALGKLLGLLTVPIVTRLLTPAEYGLADLANGLAALLAMLAMFGGDIPAARLAGAEDDRDRRRTILSSYAWMTLAIGIVMAAMLVSISGFLAEIAWSDSESVGIVVLAAVLIPLSAVQASLVTVQRLEARPVAFAVLATLDLLTQMILAVAFVALGWGAMGMVAGLVIGSSIGLAAAVQQAWQLVRTPPDWRLGRSMVVEGVAFLPAAAAFVAAAYGVRILLVDWGGQAAVGQFGVATRVASGMALISGAFSMAWGPIGLALPNDSETARVFGRVMGSYAVVAVLVSVCIGALGPEIIQLVSGDAYIAAAAMLPGLVMAAAASGGFFVLLIAAGIVRRGGWVALSAVAGAISQTVATAILLPAIGLQGVGIGAVFAQVMSLFMLAGAVRHSVLNVGRSVLLLLIGGIVAVAVQPLNTKPADTLAVRVALAVGCALWAGLAAWRMTPLSAAPWRHRA